MRNPFWPLAFALLLCLFPPRSSQAVGGGVGNDNPGGVMGEYNGSITTAGYYDPVTGNAKRVVDDLTVTGSVGAYPLKWTRVLNTRNPGLWSMGYNWSMWLRPPGSCPPPNPPPGIPPIICEWPDGKVSYPDGREMPVEWDADGEGTFQIAKGTEPFDRLVPMPDNNYDLLMQDGGRIRFQRENPPLPQVWRYVATAIIDPYGQVTTLTYDSSTQTGKITEPGGRYLQVNYASNSVQAFDGRGNLMETVTYIWESLTFVAGYPATYLTQVLYDDNTAATYTYQPNNRTDNVYGLIETCHDPRYAGAMKNIKYKFKTPDSTHLFNAMGQIEEEQNATTGETVSKITYPPDTPFILIPPPERLRRTETRGGGRGSFL